MRPPARCRPAVRCRPPARPNASAAAMPSSGSSGQSPSITTSRSSPPASRPASRSVPARAGEDTIAALRAAIAQDVRVIGHGVGGVGRHRHGAQRHQRGLGDRIFRPVLRNDHHPIACRHARRAQMPGAGCRHAAELAPGDGMPGAVAEAAQQGLVRPGPGEREHHRRQIWPGRIVLHVTSRLPGLRRAQPFDLPPLLPYMDDNRSLARTQ